VEGVKKGILERSNFSNSRNRISPYKGYLPNIDLPVSDDVRARGREVSVYSCANTITRLTYVDRYVVKIAQDIAANLVGQCANGPTSECKTDCHLQVMLRARELRKFEPSESAQAGNWQGA
jgi:hypothetical protein